MKFPSAEREKIPASIFGKQKQRKRSEKKVLWISSSNLQLLLNPISSLSLYTSFVDFFSSYICKFLRFSPYNTRSNAEFEFSLLPFYLSIFSFLSISLVFLYLSSHFISSVSLCIYSCPLSSRFWFLFFLCFFHMYLHYFLFSFAPERSSTALQRPEVRLDPSVHFNSI